MTRRSFLARAFSALVAARLAHELTAAPMEHIPAPRFPFHDFHDFQKQILREIAQSLALAPSVYVTLEEDIL